MASLISGYEYDIFISYRHADNKYDSWVTDFVSNLKKELEATIKRRLSIYIDENPVDGLLETHDISKSLTDKIKSLIFIPILSQTYCDPDSYAWQHEFLAYNKFTKEDQFSKDIRLRSGNYSARILPVRIHELDSEDLKLLQDELGGPPRGIDFIYKEPGVNRPLRPDDNEDKNLNRTKYRNQVNKVANSIKEILISLQNPEKVRIQIVDENPVILTPSHKSIAVLPFVNMSNDPEQEYFSDGISEEIINSLVQIPALKVAGRSSAFSFKNKSEDLRIIGEKLNVNTILEGSVRKSGNRIRITAQIIEASSGFHLWSGKFDRELNDVFSIQDEIARAIVNKLQVTLEGKPAEPKERLQTSNVEAYQLYLKGMSLFYKRGLHMFEGLRCFKDALIIDPDYALALAGLADSYTMLCVHSYLPPEQSWPQAAEASTHAMQIGNELAEVHGAIAAVSWFFERDREKAKKEYLIAMDINPYYLQARCWYSLFSQAMWHDDEEALKHMHFAVKHDPLSFYAYCVLTTIASNAGLHDEAIKAAEKAIEYDNESFASWYWLGYSNHFAGNIMAAIQAYKRALDISGRHIWALTSLLSIFMEPSEYQQLTEGNSLYIEMLTRAKTGYVSPVMLAIASAASGKNEDAMKYIIQSLDRHDPLYYFSQKRPDNKSLLSIPEYSKILKAHGLQ